MQRSRSSTDASDSDIPPPRRSERFFRGLLWLLTAHGCLVWLVALVEWFRFPLARSPYNAFAGDPVFRAFVIFVGAPLIAILGAVILRKQRQNLIGLLLLTLAGGVASFGISAQISPVLISAVSVFAAAYWMVLIIAPFYFPDGHAYPRFLGPVLPGIILYGFIAGIVTGLGPATITELAGSPPNPFYVPGAQALSDFLLSVLSFLMLPLVLGVFISPVLRFRQADQKQRRQIKWFAWWSAVIFVPYLIFYVSMVVRYPDLAGAPPALVRLLQAAVGLIGLFPPIVIAFSILRYQLFDIDVIIRKTLVYSAVTLLLGLVYAGTVILLQGLAGALIDEQSPLVIVVSTLLVAALFAPVRQRVQTVVDRRFYRQKYNSARVLEQFALSVRNQVELETLTADLLQVMQDTLQPERVSVWLKPARPPDRMTRT